MSNPISEVDQEIRLAVEKASRIGLSADWLVECITDYCKILVRQGRLKEHDQ